ncbi:MAG: hypothetical protein AAGA48_12370 [Myxococcota bacterium]
MSDDKPSPLQELEQLRDRLKLQMHLASMDAKDEWAKLESRFEEAKRDVEQAAAVASETVESTVQKVTDELKEGYQKLAALLGGGESGDS